MGIKVTIKEGLLSSLLVLAVFVLMLFTINAVLPSGISLSSLLAHNAALGERIFSTFLRTEPSAADAAANGRLPVAHLTAMQHQVKIKPRAAVAWSTALLDMPLFGRDALQTLHRSAAVIEFYPDNELRIGADALVIIRGLQPHRGMSRRRPLIMSIDGPFHGRFQRSDDTDTDIAIELPDLHASLRVRPLHTASADFEVKQNLNDSYTIAVFAGIAQIANSQSTIHIHSNHSVTLAADFVDTEPVPLMSVAELLTPGNTAVLYYRELPPPIQFTWKPLTDATHYQIRIATDPELQQLLVDEMPTEAQFQHENLKAGRYYWSVRGLSDTNIGHFSAARRFDVQQDLQAPRLRLDALPKVTYSKRITVSGTTEPGAKAFINSRATKVSAQGRFKRTLTLEPGTQVIAVESIDAAGNISFASHTIIRKL